MVRRMMLKCRRKELLKLGLSPTEIAVLFVTQVIGQRATPNIISQWIGREAHSTSSLLERMEKRGLVRRVKDLERKNLVRVILTENGYITYNRSTKRDSIHKLMSALSPEERKQFQICLKKLWNKALQDLDVGWTSASQIFQQE